jgi:hypothetical protein
MNIAPRVAKLVAVAGHSNTDDKSALNAIRLARKLAEKEGQAIHEVLSRNQSQFDGLSGVVTELSYDEFQERMTTLEKALEIAQKGYKKLAHSMELSELRMEHKHVQKHNRLIDKGRNEDGSMPWGAFEKKASAVLGKLHGMRSIFSRHMNVPLVEVDRWRKEGTVPLEAVEMLKTFGEAAKNSKQSDSIDWTFEMDDEVMILSETNADREMAEILTKRWGKEVTFGGVKKARQRARAKSEALRLYDSGIDSIDEISRRLIKDFGPGFGGVSKKSVDAIIKGHRLKVPMTLSESEIYEPEI